MWSHYGISFVKLDEAEIRHRFPHFDKDIKYGVSFSSYTLECSKYLPYLKKEIEILGGHFLTSKLKSLSEISERYEVIINCSGLGAKELVNDSRVVPVRGQILYAKAPWVKEFVYNIDIIDGNVPYIIPNIDSVILGETKQENSSNVQVAAKDRQWILEHTKKLMPSIEKAEIIGDWVGLRPGRDEIRLESERILAPTPIHLDREITVIHNYGHSASGITLSWGCAENVMELLKEAYKHYTSKL